MHRRIGACGVRLLQAGVAASLLLAAPAGAQERKAEGNAVERTAKKAAAATERTAQRAVGAVKRGAKATDKALTNAAKKTDNWVKEKTR